MAWEENSRICINMQLIAILSRTGVYSDYDNKDVARPKLALWFNQVEQWNCEEFNTVIKTFQNHYDRILNFFNDKRTNASAESFNCKLKTFRAEFRGVNDLKFYLYRVKQLFA